MEFFTDMRYFFILTITTNNNKEHTHRPKWQVRERRQTAPELDADRPSKDPKDRTYSCYSTLLLFCENDDILFPFSDRSIDRSTKLQQNNHKISKQIKKMGREYDIVVFGSTGFTGSLVAEYLLVHGDGVTHASALFSSQVISAEFLVIRKVEMGPWRSKCHKT